ncbi:GNAT family N-acetyltransferase [Nesterenkonia ebinurensis]|uniref:GNAT family N-acetyltransferase n=1 Tax=Nesterenkonia ebinurensis TaxID=2608252 RepID=UPI00168A4BCF|nr:GNAT family N-acetyltransferase [Nesterenkonia ebinurensis]
MSSAEPELAATPVLLTQRLRLRAPDEEDVEFALDVYSRHEVVRYIGTGEVQTTREQACYRIARYRSQFGPAAGVWLIEQRDARLGRAKTRVGSEPSETRLGPAKCGACGAMSEATEGCPQCGQAIEQSERTNGARVGFALMKPIPFSEGVEAEQQDIEIGWHLHPSAWGSGFASEAAQALVDHARAQGLGQLVAVTHAENAASQAVARRLGMRYRGSTDRYYNTACELFTLDL